MKLDADAGRILIDRDTSEAWIAVAHSARIMQDLLLGTPPAVAGSTFAVTNEFFPKDPVERWTRSYLSAALEHLLMWADLVTPLKLHPEAELHHYPRPAQTSLARRSNPPRKQCGSFPRATLERWHVGMWH